MKSIRKGPWLISYQVHNKKVIEVLSSIKNFKFAGWSQTLLFGNENINVHRETGLGEK